MPMYLQIEIPINMLLIIGKLGTECYLFLLDADSFR